MPMDSSSSSDDRDVWTGFAQSVTYLQQVAAVYHDTFIVSSGSSSQSSTSPPVRKKLTRAHLDAAKAQAREALGLLASNILNASTAIVATLDVQDAQTATLATQLDTVSHHVRRARELRAQRRIANFYACGHAGLGGLRVSLPQQTSEPEEASTPLAHSKRSVASTSAALYQ